MELGYGIPLYGAPRSTRDSRSLPRLQTIYYSSRIRSINLVVFLFDVNKINCVASDRVVIRDSSSSRLPDWHPNHPYSSVKFRMLAQRVHRGDPQRGNLTNANRANPSCIEIADLKHTSRFAFTRDTHSHTHTPTQKCRDTHGANSGEIPYQHSGCANVFPLA